MYSYRCILEGCLHYEYWHEAFAFYITSPFRVLIPHEVYYKIYTSFPSFTLLDHT